jgi:hydroxymethylpyrimidine/phosphomethylpyrimidine kinase
LQKSPDHVSFHTTAAIPTVLTIAGFDPSSGAGVTADLLVFAAHGLFGSACITALTVQSTLGVRSTHPVADKVVAETLDCLHADIRPCGIKIGMLANAHKIAVVIGYIDRYHQENAVMDKATSVPIVLDPVIRSSSGRELLDPAGIEVLRAELLPLVDWVTPNLQELATLSGRPVAGPDDVTGACRALQTHVWQRSARRLGIIATGGHLNRPDDFLLRPNGEGVWLPGERVVTQSTHGTGCAFSSAFLSRLVLGDAPLEAAQNAKRYVAGALLAAEGIGTGNGPLKLLWKLAQP